MFSDHVEPVLNKREPFDSAAMRQEEIARALGISNERVRQLQVAALRTLRQRLKERGIVSLDQIL
jgi:DNA-directed RNA polymerase sigma subunit (sigma70/sigma32)